MNNIFENIIIDKQNEEFIDILKSENVRVERIVSNGQASPKDFWYDQDENEFVLVLEGSAILEIEEKDNTIKEINLQKGDFFDIKANVKHRVKYTDSSKPTIWLAVFY